MQQGKPDTGKRVGVGGLERPFDPIDLLFGGKTRPAPACTFTYSNYSLEWR